MSFTILFRRSSTAGHVPNTTQISLGEPTINTNDGILYFLKSTAGANSIVAIGPVPPTANALTTAVNIALTGDATGTVSFNGASNVAIATTFATVNSNIGTYGGATNVPTFIVNNKGLITSVSNTAISFPVTSVFTRTGAVTLLSSDVTGALGYTPVGTLVASGDVTGTSSGNAITLTLATVSTAGTYGTTTSVPVITLNAKGLVTAVTPTSIAFPVTSVFTRTGAVTLLSSDVTGALGYTPVNNAVVGASSGIATLDGTGKLTSSQIPASVTGALIYQGTWNASTNSPSLASGTGTKGYYYKVSVAGTTTLDGNSNWYVGDSAVFDGSTWDHISGYTNEVISVAGRGGAVTLSVSDISGAAPLASPAFTGTPTSTTPTTSDNSTNIATTAFIKNQNYTIAPLVASGDATGTATGNNTITLTLASITTAGTFGAVIINAKGLITGGLNTSYTGDLTGSTTNANAVLTLNTVNSNVGSFGSTTAVPAITVNAKGLVTAVTSTNIAFPVTSVFTRTGAVTLLSSDVTGALGYTPVGTLVASGDVSGTSSGNTITLTLATVSTAGTYGAVVINAKGQVTSGLATSYTGDVSGTTTGANATITLNSVNANVGTWNTVVVNAKGLVISASNTSTGGGTISITGDATGSGSNSIVLTLATVNSTPGTFAGIVVNGKGLVTSATALTTLAGYGITSDTIDGGSF
jgi:hypothetical protein